MRPVVADYISATFEPAWESVRPAPLVTIDFGNGHTVKRTLQGNIVTYVCSPAGTVYDVLPGIYTPAIYRRELEACKVLAESLAQQPRDDLSARLRGYHARQGARLGAAKAPPQMQAIARTGGGFKGGFGGGNAGFQGFGGGNGGYQGFQGGNAAGFQGIKGGGAGGFGGIEGSIGRVIVGQQSVSAPAAASSAGPLASRPELALDAEVNELIRRRTIHERLARLDFVRPDDSKKWLFKDVLHADLDDPLLGLGPMLNDNYPFTDEDRAAAGRKPIGRP